MTHITLRETRSPGRYDMEYLAEGHAGYAKPGEPDVVCAAVSMISCTLEACLRSMEESGGLRMTACERDPVGGRMHLMATAVPPVDNLSGVIYFALQGILLLEDKYPEHVWVDYDVAAGML